MKFSLKTLAAAVVMATAASGANAVLTSPQSGNGGLFLNVWDNVGSYTFDLGKTIDTFQSDLAATGLINQTFSLTGLNTFLNLSGREAALSFNLLAADTSGARRLLATFTSPLPGSTKPNDSIRTAAGITSSFVSAANPAGLNSANNISVISGAAAYAGAPAMGINFNNSLNFPTTGTLAGNTSIATGLSFLRIDAAVTGTALSTYTPYLDGGNAVKVFVDSQNILHIQAVPEPESYAMLLAGLGMLGFMARRRLNNRV